MNYSERQKIEKACFNTIVHEKWDGKSLQVDKEMPPFREYSGDLLDSAHFFMGNVVHKKILEVGCGNGELSVWLAKNSAEVWGVDISDESIAIAEKRSKENNTTTSTHFYAQPAEALPFANNFFDIVFINVTLHHLVIEQSLKEFHRVLKNQGTLIAIEPLAFSPIIQKFRTSKFCTTLYPIYQETPTERILTSADLIDIKKYYANVEFVPFRIFSPFIFKIKPIFKLLSHLFYKKINNQELRYQLLNRSLQRFDERILKFFPRMKFLSRYVVIKGQKM